MEYVTIIANPRTGSNFFADTFSQFPDVVALSEIFHQKAVFGLDFYPELLQAVSEFYGLVAENESDKALVDAVREDPERFLKGIGELCESRKKKVIVYKAFDHHLKRANWLNIFSATRPRGIFLVRSRLETYISRVKASLTGVWANIDTRDIKPSINADDFIKWADTQDSWYAAVERHFHDNHLPYVVIEYDKHVSVPPKNLLRSQYFLLRGLGLDISFPNFSFESRFRKQDATPNVMDRIENGEEFLEEIASRGINKHLLFRGPLLSDRIIYKR